MAEFAYGRYIIAMKKIPKGKIKQKYKERTAKQKFEW